MDVIRGELRRVLEELNQVIRTLEQAEREKNASEQEIQNLRDALRGLHREPSYNRMVRPGGNQPPNGPQGGAVDPEDADPAPEIDPEDD